MSFEHRIIGGDEADDEFGPDRTEFGEHQAESTASTRLDDVESVESLDDLDVLADQLRDDASHLHSQFPADQKQLLTFAEQFRIDNESVPGLREHVDDEMQECLRRIEALDSAERRRTRRRFVRMLAMCGGASALLVIVAFAIDQYGPQARVPVAQQHSLGNGVWNESAVRDSAVFAMSASYGTNEPVDANSVTTPTEVDVDSLTASNEYVSNDGIVLVNGDIRKHEFPIDLSPAPYNEVPDYEVPDYEVPDYEVPESQTRADVLELVRTKTTVSVGNNLVPRLIARQELITYEEMGGLVASESVAEVLSDDAATSPTSDSGQSFPIPTFVPKRSLVVVTGGYPGIAPAALDMGPMPGGFGASLGSTPAVDDVPEIYRSASQPEMEAIIDLYQAEQDGSITIEF